MAKSPGLRDSRRYVLAIGRSRRISRHPPPPRPASDNPQPTGGPEPKHRLPPRMPRLRDYRPTRLMQIASNGRRQVAVYHGSVRPGDRFLMSSPVSPGTAL